MATWRFTLDMIPVAKGRPRVTMRGGKPATYTPAKTVSFEQAVAAAARAQMGPALLAGPLRVDILAVFPRTKELEKVKTRGESAPAGLLWKASRPDADNIRKAVLDGMQACWTDDAQVVCGDTLKCYAERGCKARTEVLVCEIDCDYRDTPEWMWRVMTRRT